MWFILNLLETPKFPSKLISHSPVTLLSSLKLYIRQVGGIYLDK